MTTSSLLLSYLVFAAVLGRALLVKAHHAAPSCGRCGLPLERKELGERVCGCES